MKLSILGDILEKVVIELILKALTVLGLINFYQIVLAFLYDFFIICAWTNHKKIQRSVISNRFCDLVSLRLIKKRQLFCYILSKSVLLFLKSSLTHF